MVTQSAAKLDKTFTSHVTNGIIKSYIIQQ